MIIERPGPPAKEGSAGASRHRTRPLIASERSRRGAGETLTARSRCRLAPVARCLPLCMILAAGATLGVAMPAAAAPSVTSLSASPEPAKVVQVVQLPPAVDRRVLLDLRDLLSGSGHVVVEVLAPATLQDDAVAELPGIADPGRGSFLVVSLDPEAGGGTAGALLFALASVRVAEPAATPDLVGDTLDSAGLQLLRDSLAPDPSSRPDAKTWYFYLRTFLETSGWRLSRRP